jgi:hypothetical protein
MSRYAKRTVSVSRQRKGDMGNATWELFPSQQCCAVDPSSKHIKSLWSLALDVDSAVRPDWSASKLTQIISWLHLSMQCSVLWVAVVCACTAPKNEHSDAGSDGGPGAKTSGRFQVHQDRRPCMWFVVKDYPAGGSQTSEPARFCPPVRCG